MIEFTTEEISSDHRLGLDYSADSVWVLKSEHEVELARIKKEILKCLERWTPTILMRTNKIAREQAQSIVNDVFGGEQK